DVGADRRAAGHHRGPASQGGWIAGHHDRIGVGLFAAELLGRPDADHAVCRDAGLAAGQRPRRDGYGAGRAAQRADPERLGEPDPTGQHDCAGQVCHDRAGDPRGHARVPAYGLYQVRPCQGPVRKARAGRAPAQEHPDSHRDGGRAGIRAGHGLCRGDRNRVFLAGHGQAADRLHHQPGSPRGGGLPDVDRFLPGDAEPGRGHRLYRARPAGASGAPRMTTPVSPANVAEPPVAAPVETPLRRFMADFCASKLALLGLALLLLTVGAALLAPWIAPQNPFDIGSLDILDSKLPPGSTSSDGSMTYWLGTDGQARDVFSAILYGLRTSLMVGTISALAALIIGATVGLIAAYFGGRVDAFLMRAVDIQLSFPAILVALILLAILGKGVDKVIIALVVVQWAYFARAARGAALVERSREY